jgi:DNA mismatch endonuclease (patch repair protein)
MSSVRAKNTELELEIRRRLFNMGFRYRLHQKNLPSKPDMVFLKYSAVIFSHGCFWHQHGCNHSKLPNTRRNWWKAKLEGNRRRDISAIRTLKNLGWRVMVVWECSIRHPGVIRTEALDEVADLAAKFLRSQDLYLEIPRAKHRGNYT